MQHRQHRLGVLVSSTALALLLVVPAWAQPNTPCTATLTQLPDGTFTLHVPEVILFTPTPGTALLPPTSTPTTYYSADMTMSSLSGPGPSLFLTGFGPTTAPPSFCQPTLAVQDPLTSRYSAFFPDVSFNGSTYNASIQQQAAAPKTFQLTPNSVLNGRTAYPKPTSTLDCVSFDPTSDHIKACTTFTNVFEGESKDPSSTISPSGTEVSTNLNVRNLSNQPVNWSILAVPQITQMCTVYSISTFGTYTGTLNLKSLGGTGSTPWSITAGAVGSVSGPNPASCQ